MSMEFRTTEKGNATFSKGVLHVSGSAAVLFTHGNGEVQKKIALAPGSSLEIFTIYGNGARVENHFIVPQGCALAIRDLFSGGVSVKNELPLEERDCRLGLIAKGTLGEGEGASYAALASIGKDAANCEVNVEEHAYLLGKGARASLLPGLEIVNNDVTARHASTISELDPEQVFYLMSRGLSEDGAKKEIVAGFRSREIARIRELFGYEVKI